MRLSGCLHVGGEPILTIKELLGHKSLEMTLRYAHLVPDQKRQAVARMEKAFGEGAKYSLPIIDG